MFSNPKNNDIWERKDSIWPGLPAPRWTRHEGTKKPPLATKCCGVKKSPIFAAVK
jgi:hypothetical protein